MPRVDLSPESRSDRGRLAALASRRPANDPSVTEARQHYEVSRLADHIRQTVESWPALKPEQRDRLAVLLRGESS